MKPKLSIVSPFTRLSNLIPRSQSKSSSQVLSTYELLENILQNLLPKDLRRCKLVSKSWHSVIARSQNLNRTWQICDRSFRLLLLGEDNEGMKSLAQQWSNNNVIRYHPYGVPKQYRATITTSDCRYNVDIEYLAVDSHYHEARLQQIVSSYDAYAFTFDHTRYSSVGFTYNWRTWIRGAEGAKPSLLALIGTKCDSVLCRHELMADAAELAWSFDCVYLKTSARETDSIDDALEAIVRAYEKVAAAKSPPGSETQKVTRITRLKRRLTNSWRR